MGSRHAEGVVQTLARLAEPQSQLTDGQLLHQFAAHRDEGAFAVLLQRHGGLVYAVCRNILRHDHDAEDAFQGTFLVLARRAGAIREQRAVGSWLYRVAYRVAMKARRAAERRRAQENRSAREPGEERPNGELAWRELQAMLDEELNRLPEKYRAPFVLCCLAGRTKTEAAAELGWKEGTVSSRLAHARKLLQARLARRGVVLSAVLGGLAITERGASAAVPAGLLASTRAAALAYAAGEVSAAAPAAFAGSVLRSMKAGRVATAAAAALVALGLAGTAAAVILDRPNPSDPPEPPRVAVAPPRDERQNPDAPPEPPAAGRVMSVGGTVYDLGGKGIAGARVAVLVSEHPHPRAIPDARGHAPQVLGEGKTDEKGNYHVQVAQTTPRHYRLTVLATAPGYAPSARAAEPKAIADPEHTIPLQLGRGHAVRVRFVGPDGRPAAKAAVHLAGMSRAGATGLLVIPYDPAARIPGWPGPATTDDDGCVTFRDVGPGTDMLLQVHDERYALDWLRFRTAAEESPDPVELALEPAVVAEGTVLTEDTRMPLADAAVVVSTLTVAHNWMCTVTTRTDRDGRYSVRPFRGERLTVQVYPPDGLPYLVTKDEYEWPKEGRRVAADVTALRGVLVRGSVSDTVTGQPVAGASVSHEWRHSDNPFYSEAVRLRRNFWPTRGAVTGPDGRYAIAVPPGPGFLLVKTAEPDFVHVETSSGQLDGGRGGTPYFVNALVPVDAGPGAPPQERPIRLRRGVTVRGRVVDSTGAPVAEGVVVSPTYVPRGLEFDGHPLPIRDGHFEIPGVDPDAPVTVAFFDRKRKEGALVKLVPDAGHPVVRLAPGVSARVKLAGPRVKAPGQPSVWTQLVFRDGPTANESFATGDLATLAAFTYQVLENGAVQEGPDTYLIPNLIPGARYSVNVTRTGSWPARASFQAPAAGTVEPVAVTVEPVATSPPNIPPARKPK